jgi:hypothetical protein
MSANTRQLQGTRCATPWMWTLAFGHHEDRTPMRGYEATREAAMAAFARSWRRSEGMSALGVITPEMERSSDLTPVGRE